MFDSPHFVANPPAFPQRLHYVTYKLGAQVQRCIDKTLVIMKCLLVDASANRNAKT